MLVFGALFVIATGLGLVIARARVGASWSAPPPSPAPPTPAGPLPSTMPPQVWAEAGLGPIKPDGGGSNTHALTSADIVVPPEAFAIAAGFANVDAMVDANPHLQLVDPPAEGWPPLVMFSYVIKGTADIYTFSPTGRLDTSYLLPTYKSGDAEWIFPTWGLSTSPRPDIKSDVPVYEGHFPVVSSKSAPTIFATPLATAPYVEHRGLLPWAAGTVVTLA